MSAAKWKRIQAEFRESVRSFDMNRAEHCSWEEISSYKVTPLSIVADDVWILPPEWVPFHLRTEGPRTIDFSKNLPKSVRFREDLIIRHAKRIALLDRFQSLRHEGRTLPAPAPGTWVKRTKQFLRAVRYSLENFPHASTHGSRNEEPTFFRHLSPDQIHELKKECPTWANALIARYNALHDAGLLHDWPASDVALYKPGSRLLSKASQPFSDEAYSEILRASLWLNSIQDDVLRAFQETKDIESSPQGGRRSSEVQAYRRACVQNWESKTLKIGDSFPFWLDIVGRRMVVTRHETWPVQTVLGLKVLLARCQSANAIILLAVTGMKIGELLALTQDALGEKFSSPAVSSYQFKNVDDPLGRSRDWPLPRLRTH